MLTRFTFAELLAATGARALQGDAAAPFASVSTDTRTLEPGALFLALSGPNFDGNRFAPAALAAGAAGLLVGHDLEVPVAAHVPLALHPDPRRALGQLAGWYRSTLDAKVIGVTGSCGKTTTKNILRHLLGSLHATVASPSSFNNDVGVPHTLLLADEETRHVVVEMGTNHPGEIAGLCRVARPDCRIITNVGAAHLFGLGSLEGVAREKGELAAALPRDGFCVLNAACRFRDEIAARTRARVLTFSVEGGPGEPGDLDARELFFHPGGTTFRLDGREVTSPLLGTHNVENLLGALCVARGLGYELEELLPALASLAPTRSRLERIELGGVTVFDDCYNANPQSLRAAVRVLSGMHGYARRVLVLGDMLELGELSAELHHEVGREAARSGVEAMVLVGTYAKAAAAGALEGGMGASSLAHFATTDEAVHGATELVREGDVVLVKGSRGMALERVVGALKERWSQAR